MHRLAATTSKQKTRLFVIVRSQLPGVETLERVILDVVAHVGPDDITVEFPWDAFGPGLFENEIVNAIATADLLICVTDGENHDVAFEMDYVCAEEAHVLGVGWEKPL